MPCASHGVYPRVGGETLQRSRRAVARLVLRSIPAWAGKPAPPHADRRVRPSAGLSPRGRGNHGKEPDDRMADVGSIPAWAGKPSRVSIPSGAPYGSIPAMKPSAGPDYQRRRWVYPRVGGETWALGGRSCRRDPPMVYPRVGGETGQFDDCNKPVADISGLSPRGRGNHCGVSGTSAIHDLAWAGKPGRASSWSTVGLSPRGRGNRRGCPPGRFPTGLARGKPNARHPSRRSIPAWAGKPSGTVARTGNHGSAWAGKPPLAPPEAYATVYPRVGGETDAECAVLDPVVGLGSIPAWAGKPHSAPTPVHHLRLS